MVNISIFAVAKMITQATSWLSLGVTERVGKAIAVVAMAKRLKIILDNGQTVLWNMSQDRVNRTVELYSASY